MALETSGQPVREFEPPRKLDARSFEWALVALVATIVLVTRMAFLPPTLEDQDSVNFDLGVHDFAPAAHRPHPPGYPVYIAAAKVVHAFIPEHAAALGTVSAIASALAFLALHGLMRHFTPGASAAFFVALVTLSTPLVLFNGARPMSDMPGLFFVTVAQLLGVAALKAERAGRRGWWGTAGLAAGLAMGVRAQAAWLVLPLLMFGIVRYPRRAAVPAAGWLAAGVIVWLVPVIAASGGIYPYLDALRTLVEDALPVEPLLSNLTPLSARRAAANVFLAPWGSAVLGAAMSLLAAAGAIQLALRAPGTLCLVVLTWLPYTAYHYLLQWTETLRYTIPTVPFVVLLASQPVYSLARRIGVPVTVAALAASAALSWSTWPALRAYHGTPSPPAQAVEEAGRRARATGAVVSGHFGFGRYFDWLPDNVSVIRPPLRAEWRGLAEFWKRGGQAPILFFRNPSRTTLLMVDGTVQRPIGRWAWPESVVPLMRGERPNEVELVQIDPPRWFAESGFLLTLEAGRRDVVVREPHLLWVRASRQVRVLAISGRVAGEGAARVSVDIGGKRKDWEEVEGAFTINTFLEPAAAAAGTGYVRVAVSANQPLALTGVTLRDADESLIRLEDGFHFAERDASRRLFRWMAPEASAIIYVPGDRAVLRLHGSVPPYLRQKPFTLTLTWEGKRLAVLPLDEDDFLFELPLPRPAGAWGRLRLSASQWFVPDEIETNGDRRVLSLCFYEVSVADP